MLQRLRRRLTWADIFMWLIGAAILALVVVGSILTLTSGRYGLANWISLIIDGLSLGGIYALIALGYTLVYGILRMINFAHGEVFMSGPFTAYFVITAFDRSGFLDRQPIVALLIVLAVAVLVSTGIAVLLRTHCLPSRSSRSPILIPRITAIGASFFLQYTFRGLFGSGIKSYPQAEILKGGWRLGDVQIQKTEVIVIVSALVMLIGLWLFVERTKIGRAMQAVAEDKDVASLMGIDVDRIIVITFVIGGALAGAAGMLYSLQFRQVEFLHGLHAGAEGIYRRGCWRHRRCHRGSARGTVPGHCRVSLFPNLVLDGLGIPAPYQLRDALAFVMLVLVLIFRPTGIMGERLTVKKA